MNNNPEHRHYLGCRKKEINADLPQVEKVTGQGAVRRHSRVRRSIRMSLLLMAASIVMGVGAPSYGAEVNPTPEPAAPVTAGTDAAAAACNVEPFPGVSALAVRNRPTTSATRIGLIYPGQSARAACVATVGGWYKCPLRSSNLWVQVTWNGRTGFVARYCALWSRA